jgi:hypothetical protein
MPTKKIAANGVSVNLSATLLRGQSYSGYVNRVLYGGLTRRIMSPPLS